MDAKLTSEEYAQILQTIEMFEVISQAEPGDCQSYDILKEAYLKIGQIEAALQVSRKLAEAYLNMGLYSSALLECEGILQLQPNSPDIVALMGEIESRTAPASGRGNNGNGSTVQRLRSHHEVGDQVRLAHRPLALPRQAVRRWPKRRRLHRHRNSILEGSDDGNEHFAKFLTFHRIVPEAEVTPGPGPRPADQPQAGRPGSRHSLLEELTRTGTHDIDTLLSSLIDATKFGYVPLEYYDIDRSVVRMLPENADARPPDRALRHRQPHDDDRALQPFRRRRQAGRPEFPGLPHPMVSRQARRHLARPARRVSPRWPRLISHFP